MDKGSKKSGEDSAYWQVERECLRLHALVAMSHRKRGNEAVLATGRALPEERTDELAHAGVQVVNTK
jgi:hypothetical protein